MSESIAFLTRLSDIVEQSGSEAVQVAGVIALVDIYRHSLYGKLGIGPSCRPTRQVKQHAKDVLDALRREVLRAEVCAPAGTASIYTAARERIEMARRTLELHIADDRDLAPPVAAAPDVRPRHDAVVRDGFRALTAMRQRLRGRGAIKAGWEAIRQSRKLLARVP